MWTWRVWLHRHRMATVKQSYTDLDTYQAGLERRTGAETGSAPSACHRAANRRRPLRPSPSYKRIPGASCFSKLAWPCFARRTPSRAALKARGRRQNSSVWICKPSQIHKTNGHRAAQRGSLSSSPPAVCLVTWPEEAAAEALWMVKSVNPGGGLRRCLQAVTAARIPHVSAKGWGRRRQLSRVKGQSHCR